MSSKSRLRAVLILPALIILGLSEAPPAHSQTPSRPVSPAEMEAIYAARADSARMRFSAADVAFVEAMIHHHSQALTMSEMAPTHGASPTVRTLAARIINGQRDEIATMQEWLADRGQPVADAAEMTDHSQHGAAGASGGATAASAGEHAGHVMTDGAAPAVMPGMLTPAQMARLDAARGEEFDRLYLASMIFHHEGAVLMVEDLFATDGALQDIALFKLASDIQAEQRSEIERMSLMLKDMTGSPLGPALIDLRQGRPFGVGRWGIITAGPLGWCFPRGPPTGSSGRLRNLFQGKTAAVFPEFENPVGGPSLRE